MLLPGQIITFSGILAMVNTCPVRTLYHIATQMMNGEVTRYKIVTSYEITLPDGKTADLMWSEQDRSHVTIYPMTPRFISKDEAVESYISQITMKNANLFNTLRGLLAD
jgi:hypothetical protein